MVELIEWIGQVQRWSRAKQSMSKRRKGGRGGRGEGRPACLPEYKTDRSAFTAWRHDVWLRKTGELSHHFDASACRDYLSLL